MTGGSKGIGGALATRLASMGYHTVLNYYGAPAEKEMAEELIAENHKKYGTEGIAVEADVSEFSNCQKIVEAAVNRFGSRIDVLVNNAGIIKRQDAIEFTEENWDSVIQVNQKMVFFLSQAFAKQLMKQGEGGKIINVCSMLSYQGGIRVPSYTASKSAIIGLTRALANEWAKYNINVNGIAPGYMATNNTAQLRDDADRSEAILDRIPAGRWGTPQDMEGAVIYLASKASDYVNGFTLAVDGGWLAR